MYVTHGFRWRQRRPLHKVRSMQKQSHIKAMPRVVRGRLAAAAALFVGLTAGAIAADVSEKVAAQIKAGVNANTNGAVRVEQINTTPLTNIYEVISEGEIFYVNETGRYSFVGGSLMDLKSKTDLTALQQDKRMVIPFNKLPLQHAIKEVHGDGSRVMALFEDPFCPICRVFTKFVDQIDNVTIYRFIFPITDRRSQSLARMAWCSRDRAGVWKAIMDGARPQLPESCNTDGLVEILKLGERYGMNNTPTVVLASGKRLVGATPPEQFMEELERGGRLKADQR